MEWAAKVSCQGPEKNNGGAWSKLLRDKNLVISLEKSGYNAPTKNQVEILSKVLDGTSVIACGAYGWNEYLALLLAALEVLYRAAHASGDVVSSGKPAPSVLYFGADVAARDAFANDLRNMSSRDVHIGILDDRVSLLASKPYACQWNILCTTPKKLLESLNLGLCHMTRVELIIANGADVFTTKRPLKIVTEIVNLITSQRGAAATQVHVASTLTTGQENKILGFLQGSDSRTFKFSQYSDSFRSIDLTFTLLPDKWADGLRQQQVRLYILSSLWQQKRAVIVLTPESEDVKLLAQEMRSFLSIPIAEAYIHANQSLQGTSIDEFLSEKNAVLAISLSTAGLIAPVLRRSGRQINVCISNLSPINRRAAMRSGLS